MHRTPSALLAVAAALSWWGCALPSAKPPAAKQHVTRASVCDLKASAPPPVLAPLSAKEPSYGARVVAVSVAGAPAVPRPLLRAQIETHPGTRLDRSRLAADVRRLTELEALDDVRVEAEDLPNGVSLRFVVRARKLVGRVELQGAPSEPVGLYLPPSSGELFDRARLDRSAKNLERHWHDLGYLEASVHVHERSRQRHVDVCLEARQGPHFVVESIHFDGNSELSDDELAKLIDTHGGRANCAGAPYRRDLLERDLMAVTARYYDEGFVAVRLGRPRIDHDRDRQRLRVEIPVSEGARHRFGSVHFQGRALGNRKRLLKLLGVTQGSVFDRSALAAGMDRLRRHFEKLRRSVIVTPVTRVDGKHHRVSLVLEIEDQK